MMPAAGAIDVKPAVDLDAYFARIGWDGVARPTSDVLAALLRAHMRWIPFENLDVLLGRPIGLELDAVHWMVRDGIHWTLRARTGDGIVDCWVSTLEAENPVDFEMGNRYTATHRASPFVNRLMLRALTDDGHVAVMNRDVTIRSGDASRSLRLADRAALRALLREYFGFDLPEAETLRVPSIEAWR